MPSPTQLSAADESPGLLSLLGSLPCVAQTVQAISTFNIGPVTELLRRAAYLPLVLAAPSHRGADAFAVESALLRFDLAAGCSRIGGPAADVRFRWRFVPDDFEGDPGRVQAVPPADLQPAISQRIEVFDWELRFRDGGSAFRAYGVGRTLPGAGAAGGAVGVAFVLDVLAGDGQLAGLAGTVVAGGALAADGALEIAVVTRVMDPAGGLLTQGPLDPLPGAGAEPGVTYLPFLGEIDPAHPVTLRLSLTQGVLGSNVFEQLRVADLGFTVDPAGRLHSHADAGALVGTVSAVLDFNPLNPSPVAPVRTRNGVFTFHDRTGRSLGTVAADMIEGRSFRTRLEGMLLPVFRFGGFGPIRGGTGDFAAARGVMTMNSVISVQPRTLANSYVLRLDDPDGRYRALALGACGEWVS
jgi:hypothetical protein